MTSTPASRASLSHVERTTQEPREKALHRVIISDIEQITSHIRLLRLTPLEDGPPIKFLPGQWLDLHIPSLPKPGGFTITSPPSRLVRTPTNPTPYLELAIQRTTNPPAAYLSWPQGQENKLLNTELKIRVGGSFVFPPPCGLAAIRRLVFVAGGVGVNPLMSMLSAVCEMGEEGWGFEVVFLYSTKDPRTREDWRGVVMTEPISRLILFLDRLVSIFKEMGKSDALHLFLTQLSTLLPAGTEGGSLTSGGTTVEFQGRRIEERDLVEALGPVEERGGTVCYVCGPADMTDELVRGAREAEGMSKERVLCERWW